MSLLNRWRRVAFWYYGLSAYRNAAVSLATFAAAVPPVAFLFSLGQDWTAQDWTDIAIIAAVGAPVQVVLGLVERRFFRQRHEIDT